MSFDSKAHTHSSPHCYRNKLHPMFQGSFPWGFSAAVKHRSFEGRKIQTQVPAPPFSISFLFLCKMEVKTTYHMGFFWGLNHVMYTKHLMHFKCLINVRCCHHYFRIALTLRVYISGTGTEFQSLFVQIDLKVFSAQKCNGNYVKNGSVS